MSDVPEADVITETEAPVLPTPEDIAASGDEPKKKRGRKKKNGSGEPKAPKQVGRRANPDGFKDWIRVVKSQGNSMPNVKIHLVIDQTNNIVTIVTQANAKEGSDELEPERTQRMRITSFEVVDGAPTGAAAPGN